MNINKVCFSSTGIAVALGCAVVLLQTGLSQSKSSNFQINSVSCSIQGKCHSLLKFGVNPELYLSDSLYRKRIDAHYMQTVSDNARSAKHIAQFTLRYSFSRNIDISLGAYEVLHRLAQ